jgi:hypothetical protein
MPDIKSSKSKKLDDKSFDIYEDDFEQQIPSMKNEYQPSQLLTDDHL